MSSTSVATYPALLRSLADLIEKHDLSPASMVSETWVTVHSYDDDGAAKIAAWRRALGGTWRKGDGGDHITFSQYGVDLPGRPHVDLFLGKNACVRRVVGTETVTIPAVEAQPERTEERELVEWDCEPVLAGVAS